MTGTRSVDILIDTHLTVDKDIDNPRASGLWGRRPPAVGALLMPIKKSATTEGQQLRIWTVLEAGLEPAQP